MPADVTSIYRWTILFKFRRKNKFSRGRKNYLSNSSFYSCVLSVPPLSGSDARSGFDGNVTALHMHIVLISC